MKGSGRSIGIVVNESRETALATAAEIEGWLCERGHRVRHAPPGAVFDGGFAADLDLVVSLGGDGSILRSVGLIGDHEVPILGVNFGQLGYLTAVEPGDAQGAIARFFAGDHEIEERMLIAVRVESCDESIDGSVWHALNEATIERPSSRSTIRVTVTSDGRPFTTYVADGLIVATPTGSTAYAFSVRGPIIDPTHRSILLTPISPHMLFDRSLVLRPDCTLRFAVHGPRPASLSVDGHTIGVLGDGDAVSCTASSRVARLVTFGSRDFLAVLKAKFGLSDR